MYQEKSARGVVPDASKQNIEIQLEKMDNIPTLCIENNLPTQGNTPIDSERKLINFYEGDSAVPGTASGKVYPLELG